MVRPPWVEMILTLAGWLQGSSHMNHILAASDNRKRNSHSIGAAKTRIDQAHFGQLGRCVRLLEHDADPNGRVREMSWNLGGKP
jgi:hypothetical protein